MIHGEPGCSIHVRGKRFLIDINMKGGVFEKGLFSHPQRGGRCWKTLVHRIRMARQIEDRWLGWAVNSIFNGHIFSVYGSHITRLDRLRERKLTEEAPPHEERRTFLVEQAQDRQSRAGHSGITTT